MIDSDKKSRLNELLSSHGEVISISQISADLRTGGCMILATMESQQQASLLQQEFGFQSFGFNSLLISEEWVSLNLID